MTDDAAPRAAGTQRPPTIYDVAREAGVAVSTVSRSFSRPGRVNAETADRIRVIAERMGYRANPLAKALPTGRTSMIALVISDITNPFYNEIIRGAQSAATEAGYTMLLADAQESDRGERQAVERALPIVEGVVLGGSRMSDSTIRVIAKQRPVVVLNRILTDVPSVVTDTARGTRRAVEHLAGLGHRTITYLAGPEASWADGIRWRTVKESTTLELDLACRRIGPTDPTVSGGAAAAAEFLAHPTTAVIAYNDQVAIGLIRGLTAAGVDVPGEVSVIGFDNIFPAELVTPPLTTVAAPLRVMGHTAVTNLLAIARGARSRASTPAVLPVKLVVRASTATRGRTPAARHPAVVTADGTAPRRPAG